MGVHPHDWVRWPTQLQLQPQFFSLSFRRTSFKYTTINNFCFWLLLDHCYHPWSYWHHCCRWCCLLRVFDTSTIPSDDATSSLCALRDLSTSVVAYIWVFWHDLVAKGRSCCALYRHINWKVIAGQNLRQEVQKLVPVKRTMLFISITADSGQKNRVRTTSSRDAKKKRDIDEVKDVEAE